MFQYSKRCCNKIVKINVSQIFDENYQKEIKVILFGDTVERQLFEYQLTGRVKKMLGLLRFNNS